MPNNEVRLLSALGILGSLRQDILPAFEKKYGLKVAADFKPTNVIREDLASGLRADVLVAISGGVEEFISQGIVAGDTERDLASSFLGLAAKSGTPSRDCSSREGFMETVLAAKSIALSQMGASGVYFRSLIKTLNIEDEVMQKVKVIHQGLTGELVASGEAELAVQQISELNAVKGVQVLGPFPAEFNKKTTFTAALFADAQQNEAAILLKDFLSQDLARRSYKDFGLELE